jgi:tetrahydromethanopterin S-methyltransferase subunit D
MDAREILTLLGTPAGRADPYPLYAGLHEIGEVVAADPAEVLVVGYAAINAVLRDPGFTVGDHAGPNQDPTWRANPRSAVYP